MPSFIIDHPDFLCYDFGPFHPLRPERITAGLDLLDRAGLWERRIELLIPPPAEPWELETVHDPSYIRAVDEAGTGGLPASVLTRYGLTSTDNPPFPDMHYAASLVAGGTLLAARKVMSGKIDHAFNPAGGLHHAQRARSSGFCVYNDPAVAAGVLVEEIGARVLYIDLDCHHGDGVQWIFYDDPRVFTVSLHESGRFLFPGTGDVTEVGEGDGRGFCLNVPFAPFTRDNSWRCALDTLLEPIARRFRPDLILSNHGCDTHVWDPLTHLALTTESFEHQVALLHRLAHEHAGGRWVAVGSGGYDWRGVVPRSWAIIWAEMSGRPLPERLPTEWAERWLASADGPIPTGLRDEPGTSPPMVREDEIVHANQDAIDAASSLFRVA